uniref:C-type lectin domain-containing protein n=1 Tax=Monopterus albus TaxID=43700 RepID=A0A3Q3IXD6_MONAL
MLRNFVRTVYDFLSMSPLNRKNSETIIRMDSMEIDDGIYINKSLILEGLITHENFQRQKQPSRCSTVFLGLLCVVLLAGNIGQIIYYKITTHSRLSADPNQASCNALAKEKDLLQNENDTLTTERDQVQRNSDSLTAEGKWLEARLSNLTEEKHILQQRCKSLTNERNKCKVNSSNLKDERDQLQASYNTLKQESDQIQKSYDDKQRTLERLQTKHNNLTASKDQLQTNYSNLQREKNELQTRFHMLIANRDELQSNYSSLRRDKEKLQRSYNALNNSEVYLQISYASLWKDKEQLHTRYNTLLSKNERLQTNYSSLATEKEELQNKINKVMVKVRGKTFLFKVLYIRFIICVLVFHRIFCPYPCSQFTDIRCDTDWRKFDISCYFISNIKKNWTDSRKACMAQGADLVVIDSRDEQVFVHGLLQTGQNAWIGLTDSVQEGTWMWVDGTPLTTAYVLTAIVYKLDKHRSSRTNITYT